MRRKCSKVIIITMKICRASYYNLLLLNWYLFGVEMYLGDSHKTRFWYLLEVFSKFSDEHPRHFIRGVPPPSPRVIRYYCALSLRFLLPFSHKMSTKSLSPSVAMSKSLLESVASLRNEYSYIFAIEGKITRRKTKRCYVTK